MKQAEKVLRLFSAVILTLFFATGAMAEFPDRPLKIIVPFGSGGETDIVARLLAKEMAKEIGENVVVQNIVGASGVVGCKQVLNAKKDGYTLGVIPSGPLVMHPYMRKIPYSAESFSYVGRIIKSPYLVFVEKNSPWNTFSEMIDDMKKNPNKYFWGSSGVGSVPYFAYKNITSAYGVEVRHVPFHADPDAFQAMAGGRAQIYTSTAGTLLKYDIKALAVLDDQRSEELPEVPAISEFGPSVPTSQWIALVAPKGLPEDVLNKLSEIMKKAMESQSIKDSLKRLSLASGYLSPEETLEFVEKEAETNKVRIPQIMGKK